MADDPVSALATRADLTVAGIRSFIAAYLECALWSSTDADGRTPLDRDYTVADIDPESRISMEEDCRDFLESHPAACMSDPSRAGHDFWLTRNGHGAGFWDGDWSEPWATELTDAAHAFGSCNLIIGDDSKVHCYP